MPNRSDVVAVPESSSSYSKSKSNLKGNCCKDEGIMVKRLKTGKTRNLCSWQLRKEPDIVLVLLRKLTKKEIFVRGGFQ